MQQPSAQGIASLYRGNPQPLQQSIQKDQKAHPGLPPDLQKMLALQIVNNEKNGFAAQKAMQQLQQMGGGMGKPPTVMQSLQEQAKQKLQAQALQAQQQQQGLQALAQQAPAGAVPAGTPQPAEQPQAQGIDQLPADFQMAGGGLVAFDEGGDVPDSDRDRKDADGIMKALKFVGGLPIEALKHLVSAPGYGLSRAMDADAAPKTAPTQASTAGAGRGQVNPDAVNPEAPPPVAPKAAPARPPAAAPAGLQALTAQRAAPQAPADATTAAYNDYLKRNLTADRDVERAKEAGRLEREVGRPDTSQYDRLVAELDKRKAQFDAPKAGYEGLMEYLGKVAEGGRGRKWYEAGAQGAAGVAALNKERQTQQFELTKQAVEVAQKKIEADRAFNLDKYKAGQEGAKRIDEIAKATAQEFGLDKRSKDSLANQLQTANIHAGATLGAARIGAESRAGNTESKEIAAAEAAFARDPEAASIKKQLENPIIANNPKKYAEATARLRVIQASKYAQFGIKLEEAPGAGSPGGTMSGWGKAQVVK